MYFGLCIIVSVPSQIRFKLGKNHDSRLISSQNINVPESYVYYDSLSECLRGT